MLAAPLRIIREPRQAPLPVLPYPAADGFLVHQENLGDLPITIALMHQDERMTALAFMPIHSHVLIAADGFLVIALAQHLCFLTLPPVISQFYRLL
jgi:hypothetical protein